MYLGAFCSNRNSLQYRKVKNMNVLLIFALFILLFVLGVIGYITAVAVLYYEVTGRAWYRSIKSVVIGLYASLILGLTWIMAPLTFLVYSYLIPNAGLQLMYRQLAHGIAKHYELGIFLLLAAVFMVTLVGILTLKLGPVNVLQMPRYPNLSVSSGNDFITFWRIVGQALGILPMAGHNRVVLMVLNVLGLFVGGTTTMAFVLVASWQSFEYSKLMKKQVQGATESDVQAVVSRNN